RIGREIAEGLAAAHEHGLVHQDLRPATIWLETVRGRVKILDFGLARALDQHDEATPAQPAGARPYQAPEQATGQNVGFRADLFSLGCVLFHMATGRAPASASSAATDLEATRPDLSPALVALIIDLLAPDPAQRPPSTRAVVQALEGLTHPSVAPVV